MDDEQIIPGYPRKHITALLQIKFGDTYYCKVVDPYYIQQVINSTIKVWVRTPFKDTSSVSSVMFAGDNQHYSVLHLEEYKQHRVIRDSNGWPKIHPWAPEEIKAAIEKLIEAGWIPRSEIHKI